MSSASAIAAKGMNMCAKQLCAWSEYGNGSARSAAHVRDVEVSAEHARNDKARGCLGAGSARGSRGDT